MGRRATGPFEVKLNPQPLYDPDETALLGRNVHRWQDRRFRAAAHRYYEPGSTLTRHHSDYALPGGH